MESLNIFSISLLNILLLKNILWSLPLFLTTTLCVLLYKADQMGNGSPSRSTNGLETEETTQESLPPPSPPPPPPPPTNTLTEERVQEKLVINISTLGSCQSGSVHYSSATGLLTVQSSTRCALEHICSKACEGTTKKQSRKLSAEEERQLIQCISEHKLLKLKVTPSFYNRHARDHSSFSASVQLEGKVVDVTDTVGRSSISLPAGVEALRDLCLELCPIQEN